MRPETLLLRQIHPSFVQAGRVTSQAFRPTPKDENFLSVYDGDQIQAFDSWKHFTETPGCKSQGVMAVSNFECLTQALEIVADGFPFKEHVSINFSAFQKNEIEKKAKILSRYAQERGWLYQVEIS